MLLSLIFHNPKYIQRTKKKLSNEYERSKVKIDHKQAKYSFMEQKKKPV